MRILYLWRKANLTIRNTTNDYVHSFKKYDKENEYFYFDIWRGRYEEDYGWIESQMFDVILFDCTAMALRTAESHWDNFIQIIRKIKDYNCLKLVFTQDDYTKTDGIWSLVNAIDADAIFTVMREQDIDKLYAGKVSDKVKLVHILTGYIEEKYIEILNLVAHKKRPMDVVYRAKKLPYHFGKHGQLKYEMGERMKDYLANTDLNCDISSTDNVNSVIMGNAWFDFLASSRTVLGCLSGSSLVDYDGKLCDIVVQYMSHNPNADYDEVKVNCFPNREETLTGALSPRVFEAALTKTCQVLVGEDYHGIFRPNIDYIVLNEDYSNIEQVVEKIKDIEYCEAVAESCYEHVVKSGQYTYQVLVDKVIGWIKEHGIKEKPRSKQISVKIQELCDRNNRKVEQEMRIFFS